MDQVIRTIAEYLGTSVGFVEKLLATLLAILILWGIRRIILAIVFRRTTDTKARYGWNKGTRYGVTITGILVVGRIWFAGIESFATWLGLVSAGIAFALKDPIANLAGWLFILWRRPFEVGDRIEIAGKAGDVIDQRPFQFTILEIGNWVDADQSTGRIIHVPNGKVFTDLQANYTRAFAYIWDEIGVLVTFESDWRAAKQAFEEIVVEQDDLQDQARRRVQEASSRYMIFYNKLTPKVYTSVRDSGVLLSIRFLCEPRRRRLRRERLWEAILDVINADQRIELAYPTQRFFTQPELREGRHSSTEPADGT